MSDAIIMQGVRKTFGQKVAVDALDLRVATGSLTGFIGPNGAGKSTAIRMIMAILFPDSGSLEVLGRKSAIESKDRIGYLPEERGVYKKMKVAAFLTHIARLKGVDGGAALSQTVHSWLDRVGLGEVAKKKCEELSKGMQQKVQFISCVLHEPDLLILDEPFSGLDPVNMRLLRDLIREQHESGKTVIFSTHVMAQAEQLCDHIVMINEGVKVLDDTLEVIRGRHTPRSIWFDPINADDAERIEALPGVESVRQVDGRYAADIAADADPSGAMRRIAEAVDLWRVEVHRPTLEDIFIEIASGVEDSPSARAALRAEATP